MSVLTSNVSIKNIKYFQDSLINWYSINGRKFPWRNKTATNYIRIISEVLLQRTKAETVANYFPFFISKYPSWKQLGNATEIELKEVIKPLGLYNQRGNRLYKLAQEMKIRNGQFPNNRNEVEEMSMIGQYIANAYELFILKKPAPLLDSNMARVLERFFGKRKLSDIRYDPYLQKLSSQIVEHEHPNEINWAILDFASLVCKINNPLCKNCILNSKCNFYNENNN